MPIHTLHGVRRPHLRKSASKQARVQPRCERLEDRVVPTRTVFQQGVGGYTGAADTYVRQSNPDYDAGGDGSLVVISPASPSHAQGLLRFDRIFAPQGPIPVGAVIHSAALNFDTTETTAGNISLHRMLRPWRDTDTWNTLGNGVSTDDVEAARAPDVVLNNGEGFGPRFLNVTASLRAWSYGGTNYGWALIGNNTNDWAMSSSDWFLSAERPQLVVDWSDPEPGTFDLNDVNFRLNETAGSLTITVQRSRGGVGAVSVDYTTVDGGAVGGKDYEVQTGTLQFGPDEFSKTVTIPLVNDANPEEDEFFFFELSNPTGGAALGQRTRASIGIVDNDGPGIFQFSATAYSVSEGAGTATITVTRTRASDGKVTIDYLTECGTAAPGVDYLPVADTLTFNEGETSKTFSVPILNDTDSEANETVVLLLGVPSAGTRGTPNRVVLTITDNDPAFTFQQGVDGYNGTQDTELRMSAPDTPAGSQTSISVDQEDGCTGCRNHGLLRFDDIIGFGAGQIPPGSTIVSATLTFWTTNESGGTISLHRMLQPWDEDATWNSMDNGITPDDEEAVRTADGQVVNPNTAQRTHTASVRAGVQAWADGATNYGWALISNSTDGWDFASSEAATASQRPQLTVVAVPPNPGIFQLSALTYSVNEGATGGTVTATVNRIGGTAGPASVDFATADETAADGSDYQGTVGTVFFEDSETSKTITVAIINDAEMEEDETFLLALSNPSEGALIGENCTARVTIVDNDGPGILQLSAAAYSVNENGTTATITVTRTRASDGTVTVDYASADGTATAGVDYEGVAGTLVFDQGITSQTFTITIYDDTEMELHETVRLALSNPTGGAVLARDTAILTIMDNEPRLVIREGLNGYAGTHDTELRHAESSRPQGNNEGIAVDLEDAGFQKQGLLRFADLFGPDPATQIPEGAVILQATLTLQVTNGTNGTISLHRMLMNWDEATATWDSFTRGLQPITEHLLEPDAAAAPASGTGPRTFDVTASLRAWAAGENNFGWAIHNTTGDGWEFRSSEYTTATERPFLTVVFGMPGNGPAPGPGSRFDAAAAALLAEDVSSLGRLLPPAESPTAARRVEEFFADEARRAGDVSPPNGATSARGSGFLEGLTPPARRERGGRLPDLAEWSETEPS